MHLVGADVVQPEPIRRDAERADRGIRNGGDPEIAELCRWLWWASAQTMRLISIRASCCSRAPIGMWPGEVIGGPVILALIDRAHGALHTPAPARSPIRH
jgi:hypothetical protein